MTHQISASFWVVLQHIRFLLVSGWFYNSHHFAAIRSIFAVGSHHFFKQLWLGNLIFFLKIVEINPTEPDCLFASFFAPTNPGGGCKQAGFAKDALQRPLQCEPRHLVGPGASWLYMHVSQYSNMHVNTYIYICKYRHVYIYICKYLYVFVNMYL